MTEPSTTKGSAKRPAGSEGSHARSKRPAPIRGHHRPIFPARINQDPDGFESDDVIHPLENQWVVSDHRNFTAVDAGGDPTRDKGGAMNIYRHNSVRVTYHANLVRIAGSGPVHITHAPLGRKVVTSAQKHGKIFFRGRKTGVHGYLSLENNRVTLLP